MTAKKKPPVGTRVMWRYGRKEYVDYGEIGTVTAHSEDGVFITVEMDDEQPFHRWMFGAKSKRGGHARTVDTFRPDEPTPLVTAYRDNARRFRAVAKEWDAAAKEVTP